MKFEEIKTVSIFGSGTMGNGIAQITALQGYHVFLRARRQSSIDSGMEKIKQSLQKATERGIIPGEQAETALGLITLTTDLKEAATPADFIIEAVPEIPESKKELYEQLDEVCKEEAIFATNTSTLSITELAAMTKRPAKFIGAHFFNPVPQMRLVEIIRGLETSDETAALTEKLMVKIGKSPISINDAPGFAVNRMGFALFLEASRIIETGIASPEAVDTAMKLGAGHRMGPFETIDLVGLDSRLNSLNAMYEMTGDVAFKPPQLLRKLVASGYLGNKPGSKGGYYTYFGIEKKS